MQFEDFSWVIKMRDFFHEKEPWIDDLAELRGESLYDHGKRPAFLHANHTFYDRDEFEAISTHILTYHQEKLIGAIRLLPINPPDYSCIASQIVGKRYRKIMENLFYQIPKMLEINRLVVHKDYQHFRLGVFLCAAAFVAADNLNYLSTANGNIELLKTFHLKHLGGCFYPEEAGPYVSQHYNDNDIYLIYFNKKLYSPFFLRQMDRMRKLISFENLSLDGLAPDFKNLSLQEATLQDLLLEKYS